MILTDTLRDDQAELYQRTVQRLEGTGKHTRLAQIIALAEEVEEYRAQIDNLQKACDHRGKRIEHLEEESAYHVAKIEGLAIERDALRNALAIAQRGPSWNPVAERLPSKPCVCLVVAGIQVTTASWLPEENFWRAMPHGYIFGPGYVTHWMDLPKLPEEVRA